jgi:hypothetical protein
MGMPAWLRERWEQVLEPALLRFGVAQEAELRAMWEAELVYWREDPGHIATHSGERVVQSEESAKRAYRVARV